MHAQSFYHGLMFVMDADIEDITAVLSSDVNIELLGHRRLVNMGYIIQDAASIKLNRILP